MILLIPYPINYQRILIHVIAPAFGKCTSFFIQRFLATRKLLRAKVIAGGGETYLPLSRIAGFVGANQIRADRNS